VEALVLDAGKTYELARGEVKASIDRLEKALLDLRRFSGDYIPGDWDAHTLETEGLVRREPYGVVACITPFNYPLYDSVMKVVASFVTANAIILKPSLHDPIAPILFARLLLEAGFPPRALMLAVMEGEEFSKVLPDKRIGAVLLTGSSETGRRVLATAGVKSYLLELGGGDPAIVLGDADLESAARDIVTGIISYSGQRCDAIKIVLVESQVYDIMRRLLVSELERRVRVGDPRDPSVTVGPLISVQAVDKMEAAIRDALEKGGRLLFGGKRLGPTYIEPALIEAPADKVQEMELYRREVFAPVALLVEVTDLDHALRLANGRPYGLDACIFSKNLDYVRRAARYLEVGAVYVNMFPRHGIGYYPYGGRKESGVGVEGIGYSIEYTSAYKSIVFNYKGARIWDYVL
ncbi:MAG: aldehyde dehydrogenase family protein, partial [Fervidicoccaceae archaeon]